MVNIVHENNNKNANVKAQMSNKIQSSKLKNFLVIPDLIGNPRGSSDPDFA
jgi:hypothetical protein